MAHAVRWTKHAIKDLKGLPKIIASRIIEKTESYAAQDKPLSFAKPLSDPFQNVYRFRVGDHRVLFEVDSHGKIHVLVVLSVRHRGNAYR